MIRGIHHTSISTGDLDRMLGFYRDLVGVEVLFEVDFSGAEIEEAVNSGLYEAFYAKTDLTNDHVLHALSETVPLSRTMAEQIERQRAWVAGRARDASRPRSPK